MDAQCSRNLGQRQTDVVVEDHDRAVVDREMPKASLELVPVREVSRTVRHRRFHPDGLNGALVAPAPPVLIRGRAQEDPIQPRVEALDVAQLRKLPPAANKRLLDGILGQVLVAEDQPGNRVEAVDLAGGELPEGFSISPLRSLDKVSPHVRPPSSRRSFDRLLTL